MCVAESLVVCWILLHLHAVSSCSMFELSDDLFLPDKKYTLFLRALSRALVQDLWTESSIH